MNLPTDHPMHLGFETGAHLPQADVVIVINSGVPWMPRIAKPKASAKVIHMSVDPLVSAAIRSANMKPTCWSRAIRSPA